MRKEFTMWCNEEDFASVKPILDQYELDYSGVSMNNDNSFVKFDGVKKLTSVNSRDAYDMFISGAGDAIDVVFDYRKFIACISGLDWLEPEDLKSEHHYPISIITPSERSTIHPNAGFDPFIKLTAFNENEKIIATNQTELTAPPSNLPLTDENGYSIHYSAVPEWQATIVLDPTHVNPEFHISFFPKKDSPISSGINISAGNVALAYMEFKKTHPEIEPFCIHDKSQL